MRGEALLLAIAAGMGSGFFMGTVFIGLGALMLPTLRHNPPRFLRPLVRHAPITSIFIPLAGISFLLWGLIGTGFGVLFRWLALCFPGGGLGSPNLAFTLIIVAISVTSFIFLFSRKFLWELSILALSFIAIFGWLLPWLAI